MTPQIGRHRGPELRELKLYILNYLRSLLIHKIVVVHIQEQDHIADDHINDYIGIDMGSTGVFQRVIFGLAYLLSTLTAKSIYNGLHLSRRRQQTADLSAAPHRRGP